MNELDLNENFQVFYHLGIALALGLIIGVQRGWVQRDEATGHRVAGVRTYTLISLLGAVSTLLSQTFGNLPLIASFLSLAALVIAAYLNSQRTRLDMSITSAITSLLTFSFGALVMLNQVVLAAAATVVTATILDFKPELHGLLKRLREQELDAGLKLLLITVVMLPILPNHGYGPWNAINPYQVWWMVVLIAGISFVGYFAVKIGGAHKGILFTSLFAGLSSSTALTLHNSRLSRDNPALSPLLAAGVLAACGTMFPRILFVCSLINPKLGNHLAPAVLVMMALVYLPAAWIWLKQNRVQVDQLELRQNPLEMSSAIAFGAILMSILLLSHLLREWLGDTGMYLLAAVSGISDVDAITLSMARLSSTDLPINVAVIAIIIAASVNSLVKAGLTVVIGTAGLSKRVVAPLVIATLGGLITAWLWP